MCACMAYFCHLFCLPIPGVMPCYLLNVALPLIIYKVLASKELFSSWMHHRDGNIFQQYCPKTCGIRIFIYFFFLMNLKKNGRNWEFWMLRSFSQKSFQLIVAWWCHMTTGIWVNIGSVSGCCLTAPSHYLNQYWLIISEVQWHSY